MPISDIPTSPTYVTLEEFLEKGGRITDLSGYYNEQDGLTEENEAKILDALILAETLLDSYLPQYQKFDKDQIRTFPISHAGYEDGYLPYQIKQAVIYIAISLLSDQTAQVSTNGEVESESWSATGYSVKYRTNSGQTVNFQIPTIVNTLLSPLISKMYKFTR